MAAEQNETEAQERDGRFVALSIAVQNEIAWQQPPDMVHRLLDVFVGLDELATLSRSDIHLSEFFMSLADFASGLRGQALWPQLLSGGARQRRGRSPRPVAGVLQVR